VGALRIIKAQEEAIADCKYPEPERTPHLVR
jgi:hypothetical protein